jgi:hypothetical protein
VVAPKSVFQYQPYVAVAEYDRLMPITLYVAVSMF